MSEPRALDRELIIKTVQGTAKLPAYPAVALELDRELGKLHPSNPRLVSIIEQDPALVALVLRVVRSGLYGVTRPINSVDQAIALLGLEHIRRIVTAASMMQSYEGVARTRSSTFWVHSLAVALAARALAELCSVPLPPQARELAFVGGLLHDIGALAMAHLFPNESRQLELDLENTEGAMEDLERERWGIDHSEIGMLLVEQWELPPAVIQCVGMHHEPWLAAPEHRPLVYLVHIANFACVNQGYSRLTEGVPHSFDPAAWASLGLTLERIPEITARVREEGEKSVVFAGVASEARASVRPAAPNKRH